MSIFFLLCSLEEIFSELKERRDNVVQYDDIIIVFSLKQTFLHIQMNGIAPLNVRLLLFQGLQDNSGLNSGAVSHFEPQVAMLCDAGPHGQEAYHSKYMSEQGEWVSDFYSKATCFKDKMDILNYCKKVRIIVAIFHKIHSPELNLYIEI